jgi:recombination associated protein RdgC
MFFKNAQIYRLPARWAMTAAALVESITPQAFADCTKAEAMRQGWVAPRSGGELVHVVNHQMLLRLRTQTKVLPGSVVNAEVRRRAAEMEENQGFAPGKKATKELKERVTDELLVKAFPKDADTWVWIDPVNGWLVVDASSPSKADDVVKLLLKAVDKMPLESLRVQRSPVAVMTGWLEADEAPAGFTIDQDATLRATGESRATVTYKMHTLEPDDIRRHIAAGKQCVKLAMTYNDRVSFSLDESLAIKGIKPLDVIREGSAMTHSDDERFDNDVTLMTLEYAKMLADLVEALGGEATVNEPGETTHQIADGSGVQQAVRALHKLAAENDATITLTAGGKMVSLDDNNQYGRAVQVVRENERASISLVQRHLRIGYNQAARLLERMEAEGVVSPMAASGERVILKPIAE